MNVPAHEQSLSVDPGFRRRNTADVTGPIAADLVLHGVTVPQSGGRFVFSLIDPAGGAPIVIGDLTIVGPVYASSRTLHAYVELSTRALRILRETHAPRLSIAQHRRDGGPLVVGRADLHAR